VRGREIPLGDGTVPTRRARVRGQEGHRVDDVIWSDGDIALREKGARATGDYVLGEYRFEVLKGVSHWILDEQPDTTAALLLDWFAGHPAD
jgi:pimeloyl-ACP methyl ester carboxylesterase